ncbi:MAG: WYL domain-containing protein [Clostridia bacterium]
MTDGLSYSGAKLDGKKALLLCVLQALMDDSDEAHPMTSADIIKKLEQNYGLKTNRNTVSRNIAVLRDLGFEISTYEENHRGAYIESRQFEPMEIRWLIDGVLNSKYLTEQYAQNLIAKIKSLGNRYFKSGMDHVSALREWPHQQNQAFSLNMELVDEAIENGWRIRFSYNRMDCDGKLHPMGDEHEVLPLRMFSVNAQYYLVAYDFGAEKLMHFRLDRMTKLKQPTAADEWDTKIKDSLDVDAVRYAKEHPHMYGGSPVQVTLKMPRWLAGAVYDAFGAGANMSPIDDESMRVQVRAAAEGMRFFVLQYGPNCEVLSPPELRENIKRDIKSMMEMYGE